MTINVTRSCTNDKALNNDDSASTHDSLGVICDFNIEAALEKIPL